MNQSLAHFKSKLSESYFSRIGILDNLLGGRHWLTSGSYKEKVIISYLNTVLPKSLKAKSGFVTFPCEREFKGPPPEKYDDLNSSGYNISKQLDVIVYDAYSHAPVYEDQDLAIVSPEAVRGIIEVKGVLSHKHLNDSLKASGDYSKKWLNYRKFRSNFHLDVKLRSHGFYIFFWEEKKNEKTGRPLVSPESLRNKLAKFAKAEFSKIALDDGPTVESAYLYRRYGVIKCHGIEGDELFIGYVNDRGRYLVFDDEGSERLAGDKTLDSICRSILCTAGLLGNRLLVDPDESGYHDILPPEGLGTSIVMKGKVD